MLFEFCNVLRVVEEVAVTENSERDGAFDAIHQLLETFAICGRVLKLGVFAATNPSISEIKELFAPSSLNRNHCRPPTGS